MSENRSQAGAATPRPFSEARFWGRLALLLAATIVAGFIVGSIVEAVTDVVGWAAYLAIVGGVGGLIAFMTRLEP